MNKFTKKRGTYPCNNCQNCHSMGRAWLCHGAVWQLFLNAPELPKSRRRLLAHTKWGNTHPWSADPGETKGILWGRIARPPQAESFANSPMVSDSSHLRLHRRRERTHRQEVQTFLYPIAPQLWGRIKDSLYVTHTNGQMTQGLMSPLLPHSLDTWLHLTHSQPQPQLGTGQIHVAYSTSLQLTALRHLTPPHLPALGNSQDHHLQVI